MTVASLSPRRAILTLRWRPQWQAELLVVGAWAVLLAGVGGSMAPSMAQMPGMDMGTHDVGVLAAMPMWALMSVAMMVPTTLHAVADLGRTSNASRRNRAIAAYLTTYVGIWLALGVVLLVAAHIARHTFGADERVLLAATLALAAAWQLTRFKRRVSVACPPSVSQPPLGLSTEGLSARFAWFEGRRCVASCWALMAIMDVVAAGTTLWMAALTVLVCAEELTGAGARLVRPIAGALALAALIVASGV